MNTPKPPLLYAHESHRFGNFEFVLLCRMINIDRSLARCRQMKSNKVYSESKIMQFSNAWFLLEKSKPRFRLVGWIENTSEISVVPNLITPTNIWHVFKRDTH